MKTGSRHDIVTQRLNYEHRVERNGKGEGSKEGGEKRGKKRGEEQASNNVRL